MYVPVCPCTWFSEESRTAHLKFNKSLGIAMSRMGGIQSQDSIPCLSVCRKTDCQLDSSYFSQNFDKHFVEI